MFRRISTSFNSISVKIKSHQRTFTATTKQQNNVIVQKFGGTSLGTPERMQKVINIIKQFKEQNNNIIAVVSALSNDIKSEGTTSRLLLAAKSAVEQKEFHSDLSRIEDIHLDIIYSLLKSRVIREDIRSFISNELNEIRTFCRSLSVIRELSPRSHDKIIGCGERMAASLVSSILNDQGYPSTYINLSNIFNGLNGLDTNKRGYQQTAKDIILKQLDIDSINNGIIPIVTGFFGEVNGGIINSIGRGYTDLTAALCAGALNAQSLQVWKESDGVFDGNPTKISNASLLESVTPEEASELTYFGNEVLHPLTMKCAIDDNIAIYILNTFKPHNNGTTINKEIVSTPSSKHGIIAVCSKKDINIINLNISDQHESLSYLFGLFNKYNVKIDLISTSISNISIAIHESVPITDINNLISDLEEYKNIGSINLKTNRSIVCCIGSQMYHKVGIAAKVFKSLSDEGINIEMISQGSSEISISVVIHADQMDQAIKAIHKNYIYDDKTCKENI